MFFVINNFSINVKKYTIKFRVLCISTILGLQVVWYFWMVEKGALISEVVGVEMSEFWILKALELEWLTFVRF